MTFNEDIQDAIESMKGEFLADCLEHLDAADIYIANMIDGQGSFDEQLVNLNRRVHSIKGTAATFGFPSITTIAHRLEDFIEASSSINYCINDVQIFIDTMRDVAESGTDPVNGEYHNILKNLPRAHSIFEAVNPARNVDILFVMHRDVQRKIIGQELTSCGFGASFVDSGADAISSIMKHMPDIVISSVLLDDMSGMDLACALEGIKSTKGMHFILLSSSDNISIEAARLPKNAKAIHKDSLYVEQLTEQLVKWGYFGKSENISAIN